MSEIQTTPILTVTWDTVIGSRCVDPGGYEEPAAYEPVSLGAAVVQELADQLRGDIKRDAESYRDAVAQARDAATAATIDRAREIVDRALGEPLTLTDGYGRPKGEPTTLADIVRGDVRDWLDGKQPRNEYYSDRGAKGSFRELIREQVHEALRTQLRAEIEKVRAEVAETVRAHAAELFAKAAKGERL